MFSPRAPAVAGRFYPADPAALDRELHQYLDLGVTAAPALAVIVPHAGYLYSGAIAGAAYARVKVPRSAIVLCPNHTGMGVHRALWPDGAWQLPGGRLEIDAELAEKVRKAAELESDALAHLHEHSAEVQLPFLRARNPEVRIVPICLAGLTGRECVRLGERLARAVTPDVLLVASTDMSHYLPAAEARELDHLALEKVLTLDAEGLCEVVETRGISMCGYLPTAVVLAACKALGATAATLVRYGHSGEASGDDERVVGYAALVVSAPASAA